MHMIKDNGRIISGLVYKAVYDLNIGFIKIYYLSYFAGIIFAALAVMILANVIIKIEQMLPSTLRRLYPVQLLPIFILLNTICLLKQAYLC